MVIMGDQPLLPIAVTEEGSLTVAGFDEDQILEMVVPTDSNGSMMEQPLSIGQEFPDVNTCRRALKDIAIASHFEMRIVKSDRSSENFRDTFKNSKLVNIFWNAVYALTAAEFESKVTEMVEISQDVLAWFHHFNPQLWAVAFFEGVRYGHFSLGVTEVLYNWALVCHELPIVQMMEYIRQQMVSCYRETYSQMIFPIPDRSMWNEDGEGGSAKVEVTIGPPKTRRPPGRPKKKVLRLESLKRPKRVVQCGRCHMLGHSQKKCTLPG
ncbi:hypothetical protein DM860_002715 [Cuscuta australis]|uniref:Transposase MuDR plant domain-containing protein n=1 Tax=Cuscuta australis TaxID=267555 RepID=A0A328CZ19_9ASTE|nr:hypothetical protein DM860_002715 [Cuscuta australis]